MTRKRQAAEDAANSAAKAVKTEHGEAAHKPEPAAAAEVPVITSATPVAGDDSWTPVAGHEQLVVRCEHAKSGRSQCRVCKGLIAKGEVRIGSASLGLCSATGRCFSHSAASAPPHSRFE
jgi:hypothetical protein